MKQPDKNEDQPINLEESSSTELERVVVSDDESPSTRTPVMPCTPHASANSRELLRQPFGTEHIA